MRLLNEMQDAAVEIHGDLRDAEGSFSSVPRVCTTSYIDVLELLASHQFYESVSDKVGQQHLVEDMWHLETPRLVVHASDDKRVGGTVCVILHRSGMFAFVESVERMRLSTISMTKREWAHDGLTSSAANAANAANAAIAAP
ncbi:hypothetical protein TcWFU_009788 [Taenia crassiceps]|uniref:Uncharacterized protein n=1 Tax=Taenia crassiceps TaxID=6207 RepID=A0ABR4QTQ1_9CEST